METVLTAAKDAAKPVKVFKSDALSVSVFRNEALRDGKPSIFFKATISKAYKKKGGEGFGRTSSFEAGDFPVIRDLLVQAGAFIEGRPSQPEATSTR